MIWDEGKDEMKGQVWIQAGNSTLDTSNTFSIIETKKKKKNKLVFGDMYVALRDTGRREENAEDSKRIDRQANSTVKTPNQFQYHWREGRKKRSNRLC